MKIKLIIILLILLQSERIYAQAKIDIGEVVPNYTFQNIINKKIAEKSIYDFKGKILILDFWTFGCTACIASWPRVQKLQEKFKDQVQILAVNTRDDPKKIAAFLEKRKRIMNAEMFLPIPTQDTMLTKLFPHQSFPHVVWIDKNSVLQTVSQSESLNEEVIQNILDQKKIKVAEKVSERISVDWSKPLFLNGNGHDARGQNKLISSTIVAEHNFSYPSINEFVSYPGGSYGVMANMAMKDMLRVLYGQGQDEYGFEQRLQYGLIELQVKDSLKMVLVSNGLLRSENRIIIQLTDTAKNTEQQLREQMIHHIEKFFHVKTSWVTKRKTCLVISRSKFPISTYKAGKQEVNFSSIGVKINNATFQHAFQFLKVTSSIYNNFPYPIIDETGFTGKLGDINFDVPVGNYKKLGEGFEKFGFKFSVTKRLVQVLVVRDDI